MTQLEIDPPEGFEWHACQHVYIRIPKLSPWDNHPFTIANVCDPSIPEGERRLRFFIRSYTGFTRRIHHHLTKNAEADLEACLDGPYGTYHGDVLTTYDTLILIAGGGGISAILPVDPRICAQQKEREPASSIVYALEDLSLSKLDPDAQFTVNVTGEKIEPPTAIGEKPPTPTDPSVSEVDVKGARVEQDRIRFTAVSEKLQPRSKTLAIDMKPAQPCHLVQANNFPSMRAGKP
ncbi:uncharacterized protein HMPREF1541_00013 [Cyphellophora europaea CBS 101466]|uniref:ferric-chelate reductase (NADPH) n=1 Tax=Cyphellophora europaea (strain CBS 101466) TaxID=1220924 RepID=W2SAV5_CYPE1|nr:uncharacterized protein HMPREF1541_00013 [Cyphellophora europaea CBS 101466]ETN45832.1 hypothetical protein HMPREF1541_00013 [Cyphellophora europaea CBS 101466]